MRPVGPFDLEQRLGSGGMGEVWAARHRDSGTEVAIKLLHDPDVDPEREIRAMAGLDHPHVVQILDAGRDDGRPWFAMARAAGSMAAWSGRSWPRVATWLTQLLQALAHAHARRVIHRDLKPTNVLLSDTGSVWLADFGIAWRPGSRAPLAAGSAAWMAPEQATHTWREFGPGTDLYAVGCIAWWLVSGTPPFGTGDPTPLLQAHQTSRLPPLDPVIDVPAELEEWLGTLLAKDPRDRPAFAADALAAFPRGPLLAARPRAAPATAPERTVTPTEWTAPLAVEAVRDGSSQNAQAPAPIPDRWPPALIREAPSGSLGLGLWGMRAVPLLGRDAARRVLWDALLAVGQGAPGRIAVVGEEGLGRAHLARAFGHVAHEAGAAHTVLQGGRTVREALVERFRSEDPAEIAAMLGAPPTPTAVGLARWVGGERMRHEAVIEALHGWIRAHDRPVLWWADHPGPDDLARLEGLTDAAGPLLVVITADDAPAGWTALRLGPARAGDVRRQLRHLLGLDGSLAAQVQAASGGRPAVAVEIVGDWVARGCLVPGPGGYRLADGATIAPADPDAAWQARLARWARSDDLAPLERAATIGAFAARDLWERAWGAPLDPSAMAAVVEGVARVTETGLELPRALRQALLARAAGGARAAMHHAAIVAALPHDADPGRRGRHQLGAGQAADAAPSLLAGAELAFRDGRLAEGLDLLALHDRACGEPLPAAQLLRAKLLRARGRPDDAARVLDGVETPDAWAVRAGIAIDRMDLDEAERLAARAFGAAPARSELRSLAAAELGNVARRRGDAAQTRRWMQEASAALPEGAAQRGWPLHALALAEVVAGDDAAAQAALVAAREAYEAEGRVSAVATCELELGNVAQRAGDLAAARDRWRAALARFERVGNADALLPRLNLALADLKEGAGEAARAPLIQALGELERLGRAGMVAAVHACVLAVVAADDDGAAFEHHLAEAQRGLAQTGMRAPTVRWAVGCAAEAAEGAGHRDRAARLGAWLQDG